MKIWLNGGVVPADEARVDPRDRGMTLGDGIFETILAVDGHPVALDRHLTRMARSTQLVRLRRPVDDGTIAEGIAATLRANDLTHGRASVRITLTRGLSERGLALPRPGGETMMITAQRAPDTVPPAHAIIATPRRNPQSVAARVKATAYLDNIMAFAEAAEQGANDALMLNTGGYVACATTANVFVVSGGVCLTPRLDGAILPGITREILIERLVAEGLAIRETDIAPATFATASEAFLTNSLVAARPLLTLDGRPIGTGEPGPITARAQSLLSVVDDRLKVDK